MSPVILARLRAVFARLEGIEGHSGEHPNIDWVRLLELREHADPLTDDAYFRGYIMGTLDALGVSVAEALQVLRTESETSRKPRTG